MRTVLVALGLALGLCASAPAQNNCLVCHSEIKADYVESTHAALGVGCVECHGGDPTILDRTTAHSGSFAGTPARAQIPQLCASCHADPLKMKPYGLHTDQYAEYRTSQHGKALAAGDTNVAVCTDCHTSHRILSASEPRSSVHPENIPNTCARCHSDQALMSRYDLRSDPLENFRKGAHGVALFDQGNAKAPHCATCHGVHGATPPGVEDVAKVCGTCHINERRYFNGSPHKQAMDERRFNECVGCHRNHEIQASSRTLFDQACLSCHAENSPAFLVAQKIKTMLVGAESSLKETESTLKQAQQMAFDVSAYRSRLLEAQAYLIQVLPLQHSLDMAQIEELTRRAHSIANDIRSEVHRLQRAIQIRWLGLALVWGYIVLTMTAIHLYRRERRSSGQAP